MKHTYNVFFTFPYDVKAVADEFVGGIEMHLDTIDPADIGLMYSFTSKIKFLSSDKAFNCI